MQDFDDNECDAEMIAIDDMISMADDEGLCAEVVRSFYMAAKNGLSIVEACSYALSEWDI